LTYFKRVRPAGLLKEKKPIYLLVRNLRVRNLSRLPPERGKWRRSKESVMNYSGFGFGREVHFSPDMGS